jgi:hypothetical protein
VEQFIVELVVKSRLIEECDILAILWYSFMTVEDKINFCLFMSIVKFHSNAV